MFSALLLAATLSASPAPDSSPCPPATVGFSGNFLKGKTVLAAVTTDLEAEEIYIHAAQALEAGGYRTSVERKLRIVRAVLFAEANAFGSDVGADRSVTVAVSYPDTDHPARAKVAVTLRTAVGVVAPNQGLRDLVCAVLPTAAASNR